jgi:hypothetical protein
MAAKNKRVYLPPTLGRRLAYVANELKLSEGAAFAHSLRTASIDELQQVKGTASASVPDSPSDNVFQRIVYAVQAPAYDWGGKVVEVPVELSATIETLAKDLGVPAGEAVGRALLLANTKAKPSAVTPPVPLVSDTEPSRFWRSLAANLAFGLSSRWSVLIAAPLLLAGILGLAWQRPALICSTAPIEIGLESERSIPADIERNPIDTSDAVWSFRYGTTGTELRAGVPYWIFRVLPKIFDDEFRGRGYERFGFTEDNQDYYTKRALPRGLVLADSELRLPGYPVKVALKRVAINCSGCHRGEYRHEGRRVLVDGMPNHTADLQGFKRFFARAFHDDRFTQQRVVSEIDALLSEEGKPPLTKWERLFYASVVRLLRESDEDTGAWMDARADNGPGRIDAFNAVKFEILKVADDGTAAQIDFPSIWNQGSAIRPWHHVDGNTKNSEARNFGSVLGVGGIPLSVHKPNIIEVGEWLDAGLKPPPYPFAALDPKRVAAGEKIFIARQCSSCHGLYDQANATIVPGADYMKVDPTVGTDPGRWKAFGPGTAAALNAFGSNHALWPMGAFRGSTEQGGYLAGPLDGIWARAPYLHNGSVPTLRALLTPEERPKVFYRGSMEYDAKNGGWRSDLPHDGKRELHKYETVEGETPIPGNGNAGHDHPVPPEERDDLIEYLKSL